jgi:hypothetical protein
MAESHLPCSGLIGLKAYSPVQGAMSEAVLVLDGDAKGDGADAR